MKKYILFFIIMSGITFSIFGQTKENDIKRLLEVTNCRQQAEQAFDLIIPEFIRLFPNIPITYWISFKEKLDIDSFIRIYIPIYDKHFSHDDIKKLIQFYESPIGKKLIEATPRITQESFAGGQEWGRKLGEDIINGLKRDGYINGV